jgi:hypothetical protein
MLTAEPAVQLPNCEMLPTTNTFSPYTVVTVGAKVTCTLDPVGEDVEVVVVEAVVVVEVDVLPPPLTF